MSTADAAREAARNQTNGHFGEQNLTDPGTTVLTVDPRIIFDAKLAPGDIGAPQFILGSRGEWHAPTRSEHEKVRVSAAAAIYRDIEGPDSIRTKLDALGRTNAPAQLLMDRLDGLMVKECRIKWTSDHRGMAILEVNDKGVKGPGSDIALDQVIGVDAGYGSHAGAAETFARRRAQFVPRVVAANPRYDLKEGDSDQVQAVYMFGGLGRAYPPGSLYLATGRHGNLVEGFMWCPGEGFPPFTPTFYADDMQSSMGRLSEYAPGTIDFTNINDLPTDRVEAYRAVMGVSFHPDEEH